MDLDGAEKLANELIRGCKLDEKGWTFHWDDAPRRFGICRYGPKQIGLSRKLVRLNSAEEVLNTILHEIAHAFAGPHAGHGPEWVRVARSLGCDGIARYSSARVNTPPRRARISISDIGG